MVAVLQHFKQANSGYIMPEFIMSNSEPESVIFTVRLDYRAVVVSRIEYAAPAWSGMCSAADRTRLDSLLRRSKRLGYCRIDQLEVADMFSAADDDFFSRIKSNSHHVLQPYLPNNDDIPITYQLRSRSRTLAVINTRSQAVARIADRTAKNSMGHVT